MFPGVISTILLPDLPTLDCQIAPSKYSSKGGQTTIQNTDFY